MAGFRENWWSHKCLDGSIVWKHKIYRSCEHCGFRKGQSAIKGQIPL